MNRHAANCPWCQDRQGGCLYCVEQLEGSSKEKLESIRRMIDAGEVHVVAIRQTDEVMVRRVEGRWPYDHQPDGYQGRIRMPQNSGPLQPCVEHRWQFDANNFNRRRCRREGCPAVQVKINSQWVPESLVSIFFPANKPAIATASRRRKK